MPSVHIPVLLHEVIEGLALRTGMTVLDATINGGGHAKAIAEKIGAKGTLIGMDADGQAIESAREALATIDCKLSLVHANFRTLDAQLRHLGVDTVDAALFDLGLSSEQLEQSGRGFSFLKDEPLSMAFGAGAIFGAEGIVNEWSESSLADVLWGYGGERRARSIARAIVRARLQARIMSTRALVEIVCSVSPRGHHRLHPATKTFQALRIAVNDELNALREVLPQVFERTAGGGRIAVISFHELEDRIVKKFMREKRPTSGTELTKKPIAPTPAEILANPRSRSAKLRIFEKK